MAAGKYSDLLLQIIHIPVEFQEKRNRRRLVIYLVIVGLAIQILFDPLSLAVNVIRIAYYRLELPAARARWERAGLADYQIDVRGVIPMGCLVAARLTLRQGEVVEVQGLSWFPSPAPEILVDPGDTENRGCKLADFAIPQVFDDLGGQLARLNPAFTQVKISFDRQYGYVTHYAVNDGYRLGLLTPGIGECCRSFDFENFEALR